MYIDTPLKPNSALVLELTALKRRRPVEIVLTLKDANRVYSCSSLPELCKTTFSFMMESEVPKSGDELAVLISPGGVVYLSHNNRGWIKRMQVDADFEYHVVLDMKHITVLSLIGVRTGVGEVKEQVVVPGNQSSDAQDGTLLECIKCLTDARLAALKPCFHVALCESCARNLLRSEKPHCPLCRTHIADIQKLYFA